VRSKGARSLLSEPDMAPVTDGLVKLRAPGPGDLAALMAGQDAESRRWLGRRAAGPSPAACAEVAGTVVGWVDYDLVRAWLRPGEVNVGYNVFPQHRHQGYATRAVRLLMHHLAVRTGHHTATLLIDRENQASLAVAARAGFVLAGETGANAYFKRALAPLQPSDRDVPLRLLVRAVPRPGLSTGEPVENCCQPGDVAARRRPLTTGFPAGRPPLWKAAGPGST
jgi:RimJ/RimL family protein N-acetyltransferase